MVSREGYMGLGLGSLRVSGCAILTPLVYGAHLKNGRPPALGAVTCTMGSYTDYHSFQSINNISSNVSCVGVDHPFSVVSD